MLSPATLERVSHSYRRGYQDGASGRKNSNDPVPATSEGIPLKPFSDFDYSEGYKAGANDAYWSHVRQNGLNGTREERDAWIAGHRPAALSPTTGKGDL